MRAIVLGFAVFTLFVSFAHAGELLTQEEIAGGWIALFDGETTFGWTSNDGEITVSEGALVLSGEGQKSSMTSTSRFANFELKADYEVRGELLPFAAVALTRGQAEVSAGMTGIAGSTLHVIVLETAGGGLKVRANSKVDNLQKSSVKALLAHNGPQDGRYPALEFQTTGAGAKLFLRNVKLRPLIHNEQVNLPKALGQLKTRVSGMRLIFNGKNLDGWKTVETDRTKSKFTVTDNGELNITNGPGDLQTVDEWDDFVLQMDVKTNGKHLNSGVFFRAISGQFWSGYESQIRNQWNGDDRTKPVDFGTGGIYRRQAARKVVPNDGEWFTKTIIAHGNHIAVWVNGYQVADFTDKRPSSNNARNGAKTAAGPISLQGHDPTTDLSFRNIRVAALQGTKDLEPTD